MKRPFRVALSLSILLALPVSWYASADVPLFNEDPGELLPADGKQEKDGTKSQVPIFGDQPEVPVFDSTAPSKDPEEARGDEAPARRRKASRRETTPESPPPDKQPAAVGEASPAAEPTASRPRPTPTKQPESRRSADGPSLLPIAFLLVLLLIGVVLGARTRGTAARRVGDARDRVLKHLESLRAANRQTITDWSSAMYWSAHENTLVRELGEYGAKGAAWSALENGGVVTIGAARRRSPQLQQIHGVGPSTVSGVTQALARHAREAAVNVSSLRDRVGYERGFEAMLRLDRLSAAAPKIAELSKATDDFMKEAPMPILVAAFLASESQDERQRAEALIERWNRLYALMLELAQKRFDFSPMEAELLQRYRDLLRHRLHLTLASASEAVEGTEKWFEDNVIVPWLEGLGVRYERQYPVEARFGSKDRTGFVDFLLRDRHGTRAVLECKRSVGTSAQLEEARAQAQSYAYALQLQRYAVAADEGVWVYEWGATGFRQLLHVDITELPTRGAAVLELLRIGLK